MLVGNVHAAKRCPRFARVGFHVSDKVTTVVVLGGPVCFPAYDLLFPRQARVTAYENNTLGCLEAGHVLCSTYW